MVWRGVGGTAICAGALRDCWRISIEHAPASRWMTIANPPSQFPSKGQRRPEEDITSCQPRRIGFAGSRLLVRRGTGPSAHWARASSVTTEEEILARDFIGEIQTEPFAAWTRGGSMAGSSFDKLRMRPGHGEVVVALRGSTPTCDANTPSP